MDRVIVNNIPSANRGDFGYRSINTSAAHNENQENILNDVLDLYNKTNEIERVVRENADFIKLENTHLEGVNNAMISKYANLIESYNELLKGETVRKINILPSECKIDDPLFGAVINDTTADITVRPSRKISKLAVFDSVTDGMYLPDTLEVDVRCQTLGVISETDNDLYAPFYNDNQMYWTRKVVTDNTCEEVVTEYVISLAEEIMTTAEMNEIVLHPFLCNVGNVYARYGDSNPWQEIPGAKYHPAIIREGVDELANTTRPFKLSFPNIKANQIKIVLKANTYIEGETNLRNFMFGLKHIGAYINYYNTYDASHFNAKVGFNEFDTVVIEGVTINFNNEIPNSKYLSDMDYEFYYKDKNGMYQKIFETFPFIPPTNDLMVKFRIGEKYKEINIRSMVLNYKVIREDYHLMISYMQDMTVDFMQPFNIYYTVKASDSHEMVEVVGHEITLDNGATWVQMDSIFNGERYAYEHLAINEVKIYEDCMIRVYDFDGRCGISNKFRINADIFDKPPVIDDIDDIGILVNEPFLIEYRAGDDYAITKHEFSDSEGERWETIVPTVEEEVIRGIKYKRYLFDKVYDSVNARKCYIRITDGINPPVVSNLFEIYVRPIEVDSIILDRYKLTIPRGKTEKLTHTIIPLDASDKVVTWSSNNTNVATVDQFGLVTAVDKRYCEITVLSNNRKKKAICEITVIIPVEEVRLNASEVDIFIGEEFQLIETIFPIDADIKRVSWSTSNGNVSVDNYGKVTALKSGACVVTVTTEDGGFTAQCTFNVLIPVEGLELNKVSIVKEVNETEQLLATVIPDNAFNKLVHYESDNPLIASVDNKGLITTHKPGTTTITATTDHKGFQKTCDVEVLVSATGVTINKESTRIPLDEQERLFATVMPEDAHDKLVTWKSSNTTIAIVDNDGNIIPRNVGSAIVTVTTNCKGHTDNCMVEVYSRITDITLSKTNILTTLNTQTPITVGFANWTPEEVESIIIESDNPNIADVLEKPEGGFSTVERSFDINIVSTELGTANIVFRTSDNRIIKTLIVKVDQSIESIDFIDPDSVSLDENGNIIEVIYYTPVRFEREVSYIVNPDTDFHLGNLDYGEIVVDRYKFDLNVSEKGKALISSPGDRENYVGDTYYRSAYVTGNAARIPKLTQEIKGAKIKMSSNWSEEHQEIVTARPGESLVWPINIDAVADENVLPLLKFKGGVAVQTEGAVLDDRYYDGSGAYGLPSTFYGKHIESSSVTYEGDNRRKAFVNFKLKDIVSVGDEISIVLKVQENNFNGDYNFNYALKITIVE